MTQTHINFDAPAIRHSRTSVAAAESIAPHLGELQAVVLARIAHEPCTDEEGIESTGLSPSTYRPRRIECVRMGLVIDSGSTRKTRSGRSATIWRTV